jgi:transglutaminase-like putative cysteine protease
MTLLTVRHITTYQYKQPVSFGEHRMMLRPRESHDQRLLESKLEITPKPTNLRWIQDVFCNHVAIAHFAGRADALRFASTIRLDHSPTDIVDMDIEDFARALASSRLAARPLVLMPCFGSTYTVMDQNQRRSGEVWRSS